MKRSRAKAAPVAPAPGDVATLGDFPPGTYVEVLIAGEWVPAQVSFSPNVRVGGKLVEMDQATPARWPTGGQ